MLYRVMQTDTFVAWRRRLRNQQARVAIARRLERIEAGSLGDVRALGGTVSELRIDVGPGYRLYFTIRKRVVVVLLCGGDKRKQQADIKLARKMAQEV
jgi:putative addiction module killer protein